MNIADRIDELVNRGFDNGLIAAVTGVAVADVVDFRRTRVAPQDPMSGGSAFAHLTEDSDRSYLVADWDLFITPDIVAQHGFHASLDGSFGSVIAAADIADFNYPVYNLYVAGEANDRFQIMPDGSLHWGDTVHSPGSSLGRAGGLFPTLKIGGPEKPTFGVVRADGSAGAGITTSGVTLGDADFSTGNFSGVEIALSTLSLNTESWPAFMLTDWQHYTNPIWGVYPSGRMVWSAPDGLSAPDVALYRASDGQPVIHGPLGLYASADDPGDDTGHGVYLAPDGIYGFFPSGTDPTTHLLTSAYDGGDGSGWFNIHKDGSLHAGDGISPPDAHLLRDALNGAAWVSQGFVASPHVDNTDPYASSFAVIGEDGSLSLGDGTHATTLTTAHLQLVSADGTLYAITVTNDGTLDIAAA